MRELLDLFTYASPPAGDDLARIRYEASIQPGFHESFAAMFPAPRQRWIDSVVTPDSALQTLPHPTLVIHGREDRIIPLSNALHLMRHIPDVRLHVFGQCGHWTQIEHSQEFNRLVLEFLADG